MSGRLQIPVSWSLDRGAARGSGNVSLQWVSPLTAVEKSPKLRVYKLRASLGACCSLGYSFCFSKRTKESLFSPPDCFRHHNRIRSIEGSQLQPYVTLETLDLSFNDITEIRNGCFPQGLHIKEL